MTNEEEQSNTELMLLLLSLFCLMFFSYSTSLSLCYLFFCSFTTRIHTIWWVQHYVICFRTALTIFA